MTSSPIFVSFPWRLICGVTSSSAFLLRTTKCDSTATSAANNNDSILIQLTSKSKEQLRSHLHKIGLDGYVADRVIIKNNPSNDDIFVYEPILGERVVFRLKGLVKSERAVAGIGRVASMSGEILDDTFVSSMPITKIEKKSQDSAMESLSMDLPTRLQKEGILYSKTIWKGRLPNIILFGRHYPAEKVSLTTIPWNNQIVIDGILCLASCIDKDGNCNFSKSNMTTMSPIPDNKTAQQPDTQPASTPQTEGAKQHIPNEQDECPVCRYMKGGPCKEQFLAWDECVTNLQKEENINKCYNPTVLMMKCMRGYEYYDMFTAGSDVNMDQMETRDDAPPTPSRSTA
eukprot:gene4523-8983_t